MRGTTAEMEPKKASIGRWGLVPSRWTRAEPACIKVLIVDDHTLLRRGLAALIVSKAGMEVIGEARNGLEAVELVESLRPDVVLMDIAMPVMNGLDATRELTRRFPGARVLVLSTPSYADQLVPILKAGAVGYLLKDAEPEELYRAIEAAHDGQTYFSPEVSTRMVNNLFLVGRRGPPPMQEGLTTREREILDLVADGCANQEIAGRMCVSVRTVEAHKAHIIAKLGLKGATDLIRYAVRRQMMDSEG